MENAPIPGADVANTTVPVILINRKFYIVGFRSPTARRTWILWWRSAPAPRCSMASCAMYRIAYGFGHAMAAAHEYAHALYFGVRGDDLPITVGKYLEALQIEDLDALGKLVDLAPKTAVVVREIMEVTVHDRQVVAGDVVVIRPGETSPWTARSSRVWLRRSGRHHRRGASPWKSVLAIRSSPPPSTKTVPSRFRASRVSNDTTLGADHPLVDLASSSKAPIARLADKVSGVFVPVVMGIALVTAIIWMVAGYGFESPSQRHLRAGHLPAPALGLARPWPSWSAPARPPSSAYSSRAPRRDLQRRHHRCWMRPLYHLRPSGDGFAVLRASLAKSDSPRPRRSRPQRTPAGRGRGGKGQTAAASFSPKPRPCFVAAAVLNGAPPSPATPPCRNGIDTAPASAQMERFASEARRQHLGPRGPHPRRHRRGRYRARDQRAAIRGLPCNGPPAWSHMLTGDSHARP